MAVQIDFWQLVLLLLSFFGCVAAFGKVLLSQVMTNVDLRFEELAQRLAAIEATGAAELTQWRRVERDLLELKADMPLHYVRREDYIRGQSVIEAKLDGLALRIQNAQLLHGSTKHAD